MIEKGTHGRRIALGALCVGVLACAVAMVKETQAERVVTVLMMPGCENGARAAQRARAIVAELRLGVRVDVVTVANEAEAEATRFHGSPTVQVAGQDIEPGARARQSHAMT
jgi:hypothetical protein